jgi:predicted RNA-binding protein YlqC (UPF0109 family)
MQKAVTTETDQISIVLAEVIKGLCSKKTKDLVRVTETNLTRTVTMSVSVDHHDYGRIIGGGGKNFRALELMVRMLAAGEGKEGIFSVIPPEDKTRIQPDKFKFNPSWGKAQLEPMVSRVANAIFSGIAEVKVAESDPTTMNVEIWVPDTEMYVYSEHQHRSIASLSTDEGPITGTDAVSHALRTIFHAIGKNNGKNVYLTVVASPGLQ